MLYIKHFHEIYAENKNYKQLKGYIYQALLTEIPIDSYVPVCLRYFYDQNGDQQIIDSTEIFNYMEKNGTQKTKRLSDYLNDLDEELSLSLALNNIGIPINIICPIMDHELKRPEQMNIQLNYLKVQNLCEYVAKYLKNKSANIEVVSSLNHFGDPGISMQFKDIVNTVRNSEFNRFNIKNSTFINAVDSEYERNRVDDERSDYYRSKEFAELCRTYDLGEAYFHSIQMIQMAISNNKSGVLTFLPKGAEFDKSIFNLNKELVVYS